MGRIVDGERCLQQIEYRPLPSQELFHLSEARFKGFSGPIGSGKSQALCQEALKLAYINAGRLGLLGAPTYPMLRDATQAALLEILARNQVPFEHNKAESVIVLRDTGSRVLLRALEDFERLRGTNLAWFGVDELTYTPEEAWLRLEGRLRDPKAARLCGFAVWTPKGQDWVYRKFIAQPAEGYRAIIAAPYENRYLLGKVPDFYERLKRSYDERFYAQEVLGEYLNANGGRVYHAFDRRRNVGDVTLSAGLPLFWALDFNVDPMCSVVAQIDGGRIQVLDEIVLARASTFSACEEFVARFPAHRQGVRVYGDASGHKMQTSGHTDYRIIQAELSRAGYPGVQMKAPRSNPAVRDRVQLVNARLCNAAGEADLIVSPRCRELIRDFDEVCFIPGSGVIDKERDPRRTHLTDALGYLLWEECGPRQKAGFRDKRLI